MKLGAFADFHAGAYPGFADDRLAEQEAVLAQAVQVFNEAGVDAILFAGDATHRNKPEPAELLAFLRPLTAARAPILAISGNRHDVGNTLGPIALDLLDKRVNGLIRLSRTPEIVPFGDLRVATLPWTSTQQLRANMNGGGAPENVDQWAAGHLLEIADDLRDRIKTQSTRSHTPLSSVLLTHFGISGGTDGLERVAREPILPVEALAALGFNAVISGHFHRGEVYCDDPLVLMCGSPYPLKWDEADYDHGCWLLDVEPGSAAATFVPLKSRAFETLDYDADDPSLLNAEFPEALVRDAIVRVRYTATEEQARRIDTNAIRRALLDAGAHRAEVKGEIVREQRPRIEGVDENLDLATAVDLYLAHKQVSTENAERIRERHARYAAQLADAGRAGPDLQGAGAYLPLRLEAESYGPFPTLDHEHETGITVVLGDIREGPGADSNGAGKSYFVNAPAVCLFGHKPEDTSLTDLVTNDGSADRMTLTHTFRVGEETYRVRRTVGKRGHTLDLERLVEA